MWVRTRVFMSSVHSQPLRMLSSTVVSVHSQPLRMFSSTVVPVHCPLSPLESFSLLRGLPGHRDVQSHPLSVFFHSGLSVHCPLSHLEKQPTLPCNKLHLSSPYTVCLTWTLLHGSQWLGNWGRTEKDYTNILTSSILGRALRPRGALRNMLESQFSQTITWFS